MNKINSLYGFYNYGFDKYPNNKVFNNKITYSQAKELVLGRAAFLQKEGFQKGDVIAILAENSQEWAITYMAITAIGVTVLTLDTNLNESNYQEMLDYTDAKAIFVSPNLDLNFKQKKYYINIEESILNYKEFQEQNLPDIKPDDISTMIFTSGTTGNPKVAQLSHKNIYATAFAASKHIRVQEGHFNFLSLLPLYHVLGLIPTLMCSLAYGCNTMFQPSLKGPDIVKSLQEIQIHVFTVVPQILELFMDGILTKAKTSSNAKYHILLFFLKNANKFRKIGLGFIPKKIFTPIYDIFGNNFYCFICGGADFSKKYSQYYENLGLKVVEGYGLTETTGPIIGNAPYRNTPQSIGFPVPGMEAEIRNKKADGIGEIWVKGDSVMPGYYNNETANKEVFDTNGWFNTGDLGSLDKYGIFRVKGRLKNVIVLASGKNVYPEEIEAYYQKSPLIKEISVFGYKIDGIETVYAVINPEKPTKESYEQIKQELENLNKGLHTYKVVNHFAISFDPLPRTNTKKIIVRKIIEQLEKGNYQTSSKEQKYTRKELAGTTETENNFINAFKQKLNTNKLYEDQTLADLDIDSLKTIDLVSFLEEIFNISIEIARFVEQEHIKGIISYLNTCPEQKNKNKNTDKEILEGIITTRANSFYNPIVNLALFILKLLSKILWQLKIINKKNIDNINNSIIISNHQSNLDILWILCSIPAKIRRNIYLLGKKELAFLKYLFPGTNLIFVERFGNVVPALKAGADILRQGKSLLIFPEGTRTKTGELSEFKTGAAYLAKNLKKDVVPVTIDGAYKIYSRKSILPNFFTKNKGLVKFGKKITAANFKSIEELNSELYQITKQQLKN